MDSSFLSFRGTDVRIQVRVLKINAVTSALQFFSRENE
jgi:hypothetical protein